MTKTAEEAAPLNLYQKLAQIRIPAEAIQKNADGFGYRYVTEDEVLAKVVAGMDKYGVSLIPNIVPQTTTVTPYHYLKTKMPRGGGSPYEEHCNDILIQAEMRWTWVNNDNPQETIEVPWVLVGQQSEASQAFGSALTYSTRYFLLKYFNIATSEDDPEVFYKKKRDAEQYQGRAAAEETAQQIHGIVTEFLKTHPDDKDALTEVLRKSGKTANYLKITNKDTAAKVLDAVKKFVAGKEQ